MGALRLVSGLNVDSEKERICIGVLGFQPVHWGSCGAFFLGWCINYSSVAVVTGKF